MRKELRRGGRSGSKLFYIIFSVKEKAETLFTRWSRGRGLNLKSKYNGEVSRDSFGIGLRRWKQDNLIIMSCMDLPSDFNPWKFLECFLCCERFIRVELCDWRSRIPARRWRLEAFINITINNCFCYLRSNDLSACCSQYFKVPKIVCFTRSSATNQFSLRVKIDITTGSGFICMLKFSKTNIWILCSEHYCQWTFQTSQSN